MGEMLAGVIIAYFGHEWVIRQVDQLTDSDRYVVVIVLVVTGEYIFRWMMDLGPNAMSIIMDRLFPRKGK